MIAHITPTELVVIGILFAALILLVVGGLLAAAGKADADIENFSGGTACDSNVGGHDEHKTESAELPCSWCQKEQAIKAHPTESHGICQRHKAMLLADAKRFPKSQFA